VDLEPLEGALQGTEPSYRKSKERHIIGHLTLAMKWCTNHVAAESFQTAPRINTDVEDHDFDDMVDAALK
jgi:hypothetical protein